MIKECDRDEIDFDIDEKGLKCWKRDNSEPIYIFTKQYTNEEELNENWENINEAIAIDFQSKLEHQVSIWNLYLIFFIKKKVSIEHKYKIEQDKFSTRKLVQDNFYGNEKEYIINKLFELKIKGAGKPLDKSLEDVLLQKFPNYKEILDET